MSLFESVLEDVDFIMFAKLLKVTDKIRKSAAKRVKFSVTVFFSESEENHRTLPICSHMLKKPLMENFNFCVAKQCYVNIYSFSVA